MYKYITVAVPNYLLKDKEQKAVQEVLDQKAKEGWRLVSMACSAQSGHYLLVFEQEV